MTGITLLTGATGFVGRQILNALIAKNRAVRTVIRTNTQGRLLETSHVESVITTEDLFAEDVSWWKDACKGVDTVIHAAWYAEPGKYLQAPQNLDCLIGTLQMAKGASLANVKRFAGIGTCFEYDLSNGFLSTATPLNPLTPYAGAKAAAFEALSQWLPAQNVEFIWCRLFYLFGEGEDTRRLVPYIRSQLRAGREAELTSGDQVRDFIDVAQAGRLIVDAVDSRRAGAVNICSGTPITVRQLAEQIGDELGRGDLLKFGAKPDRPFDPPTVVGIP